MSSNLCPECGGILAYQEGCKFCRNCAWSACEGVDNQKKKFKFCSKLNFEIQNPVVWCPHLELKSQFGATAAIHAGACKICKYCEEKER